MPGDVLLALAQFAGQTVAAAVVTDAWETVRGRFARLLGRGNARRIQVAEQWLAETQQQLTAAAGADLERAQEAAAERWAGRFADLLDEDPGAEAELRALAGEVAAQLPAGEFAAGRDVRVTASGGGAAAGVIHGNVVSVGPYWAGSGTTVAGTRWSLASEAVFAERGGTAVGLMPVSALSGAASAPVRLAPRPVFLAGRETLLADLDARLAGGLRRAGPQVAVLCGLGGAGKTSVAVEYAYRHLAEVGVCWQFPAEDPAVVAAEFAVLAAQLGARELVDPRDPVASVHAVLARSGTGWLVVFDNAADWAAVERFVPPAGPGRVLITSQSQHWPPGQALEVPVLDPEAAAGFLVNRTGDPDRAAAQELAIELGGLPLALEQAAAYMQATGTTLAGYLPLFVARQAGLLARGEAAGHPSDVAATLGLALSRLENQARLRRG